MSWQHPIWPRFLPSRIVLACARLGPIGLARHAPGTWGSLAGLLYQLLIFHWLPFTLSGRVTWFFFAGVGIWFAIAMCGEAEFRLGVRDPGEVILDEFVAMPLCFINWPAMAVGPWARWPIAIYLAGFALFRLFDITKPIGIKKLQELPGGWGVVVDDLAAALLSCAALHGIAWAWVRYHQAG